MKKLSIKTLCYIAVFTAVISVVSQFSIPLPGGVPMTLQTFIIPVAGVILGSVSGFWSTVIYILIGAIGLPVFAGWTGGLGVIMNYTGGFLISFPLLAYFAGLGDELGSKAVHGKDGARKNIAYYGTLLFFLLIGNVVNYAIGTVWFMQIAGTGLAASLTACVIPFIPTALLKVVLVLIFGPALKRAMRKAGLLEVRMPAVKRV